MIQVPTFWDLLPVSTHHTVLELTVDKHRATQKVVCRILRYKNGACILYVFGIFLISFFSGNSSLLHFTKVCICNNLDNVKSGPSARSLRSSGRLGRGE